MEKFGKKYLDDRYVEANYSGVQPISGGNSYNEKVARDTNLSIMKNDLLRLNRINATDGDGSGGDGGTPVSNNPLSSSKADGFIKESEIQQYFLYEYQANYFANTIDFECEDKELFLKIKLMIRCAFKDGVACLFKNGDKVGVGIVNERKYNAYSELEECTVFPITPALAKYTKEDVDKWKKENKLWLKLKREDVAIFQWSNSGISNWVTIFQYCNIQRKLLNMINIDIYTMNKKFIYTINNPMTASKEIDWFFDDASFAIIKPSTMELDNRLEWSEGASKDTGSRLIEFYKQHTGIYNAIFGRRTNNDFKKERSITNEVSLTEDNYQILEKEWMDLFKVFCEEAKQYLNINVTFNEKENIEEGLGENDDFERVQDTKSNSIQQ